MTKITKKGAGLVPFGSLACGDYFEGDRRGFFRKIGIAMAIHEENVCVMSQFSIDAPVRPYDAEGAKL